MRFAFTFILTALLAGVAFAGDGERICENCLNIDSQISPDVNYATVSGSTIGQPNSEYSYSFCALQGGSYRFTFCEGGGFADYDTGLSVQGPDNCGAYIVCNDDYCSLQSELDFFPTANGTYIIVVDGYSSNTGNYTLAYRGTPCVIGVENTSWGSVKALYR